ncbi:serine protease [Deinococcus radiophilus]|uniref:serine protease n=1 Tax=Deinococcus radiophilus TaxID=32062 RepID=UPI0036141EEF
MQGTSPSSLVVRAGSLSATSGGQASTASRIVSHPSYRSVEYGYDVAVIRLSSPMQFTSTVSAAALPTLQFAATAAAPGTSHIISGWGMTRSGDSSSASTVLREAVLPVAANSVCQTALKQNITSGMLCAQVNSQRQTGCHGDSGGPFASQHSGRFYVFGAVSWGTPQYCLNGPMVFARVGEYQPWITQQTGVQPQSPTTPPTYDYAYEGTLSSGQNQVTQYYQYAGGTITGELKFPASADFDLYLQKWNGSNWAYVAQADGVANPERVSYNATSGYYRWIVNAYSGSGSFVLGENR